MNDQIGFRLSKLITALVTDKWMLAPSVHRALTEIAISAAVNGEPKSDKIAYSAVVHSTPIQSREFSVQGRTAIIPLDGIIWRKASNALCHDGVTSVDVFERQVRMAAEDDEIDSIVIPVNSPGGAVTGVPEAAQAVREATKIKPVLAYADGMMASAAYYIASQASQIYALESAQVGSIGVYLALLDVSRMYELAGVKANVFKSGKFKAMGMPGTQLTEDDRVMLQAQVDRLGQQFRATVQAARPNPIPDEVMQGQMFDAREAVAVGLVDSISSYGECLREAVVLGTGSQKKGKK